jgi:hypothetical protein
MKGHDMNIDEAFPSKYVKSSDLKGREITVIIERADIEKVGDDRKLVLYFQNKEKGLICNKTNATMIADLYGNDTDQWIGREIVLHPARVMFQQRMVDAVRVKGPVRRSNVQTRPHAIAEHPRPADDFGPPMSNGRRSAPNEPPLADPDDEIPF